MTDMLPRVFVVMPFGVKEARAAAAATGASPATTAIAVNFDAVYEQLIAPALVEAGCAPFRADQEPGAGDIRTDMYYELVTADLVVADISLLNANVFYELGVRHGVAPRGVFMIHGGWSRRPFDVAPDRTFDYDGKLFVTTETGADDAWKARLDGEVKKLGRVLRDAIHVDPMTIGSPVYKEMVGLKAVDTSGIQTARAKYFGDAFVEWRSRIENARLNGWPGDILTLADEAPTRFHRTQLLWHAADALCSMERFEAALPVLDDLLATAPDHREGQIRKGLVLGRLDKAAEAKVYMTRVARNFENDVEAHGILGRIYKNLWRIEWKDLPTLDERQRQAIATSSYLVSAVQTYDQAARRRFDFYTGVNVVSFVKLLEHLAQATGDVPVDSKVTDVDELAALVRFAAKNALSCAGPDAGEAGVWASAALGEVELVAGDPAKAVAAYRTAANAPATTYFSVRSMIDQVELFESLGFRPEAVASVRKVLEQKRVALEAKNASLKRSEPRFRAVVVGSGHMIDEPDRAAERFPARKERAISELIAKKLEDWNVGSRDLVLCGAARGTDIIFAERALERGAQVCLMLALPQGELLDRSIRLPGTAWEDRYFALLDKGVKVLSQVDRLKAPPKDASPFARNNLWIVNTARVEVDQPAHLYALLVWDEQPTGDGPGGTSDFANRVKRLGGRTAIINPTRVDAT